MVSFGRAPWPFIGIPTIKAFVNPKHQIVEVSILKEHLSTDIGGKYCMYVLEWRGHLISMRTSSS